MSIVPEIPDGFKYCPECKRVLPLDKFRKRSKYPECIRCRANIDQRKLRERVRADPERNEAFKARDRQVHRNSYAKRSGEILERQRQKRKDNPEQYREYDQRAYQKKMKKYPEKVREWSNAATRRWLDRNREKRRFNQRAANMTPERHQRRREMERIRESKYPERRAAKAQRRRAFVASAEGNHTAADIQAQIRAQTDKKGRLRCWWCGEVIEDKWHLDHRIALSIGGTNAPENLCISCPPCNLKKGALPPWEFNGRLL